jgi:hypothetical protein
MSSLAARVGAVLGASLLAFSAAACPNCFGGVKAPVLRNYYISLSFLSLLPLMIIAGVGLWAYRHFRHPGGADLDG